MSQIMNIRDKLASTVDDFKVTDRLFTLLLIRGYRDTDRYVDDEMENDMM